MLRCFGRRPRAGCCTTLASRLVTSYLFFFPNAVRQLRRFEPSLQRSGGAQYLVIGRRLKDV
jgi:hypothetical protein